MIPIIYIEINDSEKTKYKTDEISTFPQVYLVKKNTIGELLVGGCDDTKKIIEVISSNKKINKINMLISQLYPSWSEKAKLRLIELFLNNKK